MAEDQMSGQTNIAGYPVDDIVPNLYEGGFKTWECAVDLAQYLHKNIRQGIDPRDPVRHFIEVGAQHKGFTMSRANAQLTISQVGAGTALPTLVLFNHFLMDPNPDWSEIRFWFADYNPSVIETTTVPNLLLTWHFARAKETLQNEGELEITDSLLSHFLMDLSSMAINLTGISGAWGDSFCDLVKPCNDRRGQQSVVFLASETIYSLHSIRPFTEVLVRTLNSARNAEARATALVAAKRMYFGVGGGTDEFLKILGEYKGRAVPVWEPESPGVGRVILEISEDT